MNRDQAKECGYAFSGIYERDKEIAKTKAKELRANGDLAVVVTERPSKYSRGFHSSGYSVYFKRTPANQAAFEEQTRQNQYERECKELIHSLEDSLEIFRKVSADNAILVTSSVFAVAAAMTDLILELKK